MVFRIPEGNQFDTATWKYVSARKGETAIQITGATQSDVELLIKAFKDLNTLKQEGEFQQRNGQISKILTFLQPYQQQGDENDECS